MLYNIPISCARSATGRRSTLTNLKASNLISTMLLSQANNGASGKAATKIVMKPNCMTENIHNDDSQVNTCTIDHKLLFVILTKVFQEIIKVHTISLLLEFCVNIAVITYMFIAIYYSLLVVLQVINTTGRKVW